MSVDSDLLDHISGLLPAPQRTDGLLGWRQELSGYCQEMKELKYQDNDSAMAWLSSVSARVLEMMYFTLQQDGRVMTKFRVEEVIPLRDELRFQFQIASRRQSVAQMDFDLARGQTT